MEELKEARQVRGSRSLHSKFHVNVFTVLASSGRKPQLLANFDFFWGSCTGPLLPMSVTFGVLKQTKCHLSVFILSASGGQKPQFLGKF